MLIRDFEADDDVVCRAIASRAAMSSYGANMPRQLASLRDERFPLDPCDRRRVAVVEGQIVGFVEIKGSHVSNLLVDPSCQGRGAGAALLADAEALIPGDVTLGVFVVNPRARAFYERAGYAVAGTRVVSFRGFEEAVWSLIKRRQA